MITKDVKWEDWKITDPAESLKIFYESDKEYLVPSIEEYIVPMSEPEDKMPLYLIPDEV